MESSSFLFINILILQYTLPNLELDRESGRRGWSRDQARNTHIARYPFVPLVKQAYMPNFDMQIYYFQQYKLS